MLARLFFLCSLLLAASVPVQSQIPAPFYSLTFATQPSASVNGTAAYVWEQVDQSDVACGISQYHQGLIVLSGGPGDTTANNPPTVTPYGVPQYLNLSASSGPYNVDSVMPVIFGNSTAGGWTVEVTFKAGIQETWGKLIDFGSLRTGNTCNNDFYLGWNGGSQNWATGSCDSTSASNGNNNFGPLFVEGAWYHVVISITQLGNGTTLGNGQATWNMYVNGAPAGSLVNISYPQAAVRQNAVIGNSNWGDSLWAGVLDTFNVYSAPLTATQVASLSASALGSSTPTVSCTAASTATTVPAGAVFYTNTFNTNPITTLAITNPTYQWASTDSSDSTATQTLHTGLILLNGSNPVGGFANMTATSGASAVSTTPLGPVGGQGTGSISDGTLGWSFEVVYKPFHIDGFGKLYDISNGNGGGGIDDILYGYNGGSGDYECDYLPGVYNAAGVNQQILTPAGPAAATLQLGSTWYHHIWVIQYNSTSSVAASADRSQFYGYLNGNLTNTLTNAVYPPLLQRINGFLGRSAWNDTAWQGYVDTFRVYSIALTAGQVQTLYQQAMVTGVPTNAPGASSSSSGVVAAVSSSSVSAASAVSAASSSSAASAASAASAVSAVSSSAASAASAVSSSAASAASAVSSSAVSAASAVSSPASAASAVSSSASAAISSSSAASAAVSSSSSAAAAGTVSSSSSSAAASVSSSPSTAATQGVTSSSSPSTPVVVVSSSSSPAAAASVTSSSSNIVTPYVTSASSSSSVAVPAVLSSSSSASVGPSTVNGAGSQSNGLAAMIVAVMAVVALLL